MLNFLYKIKILFLFLFILLSSNSRAEIINKIPPEITQLDQPWEVGLKYFEALLVKADLVLAHNASFDRQWFGRHHLPSLTKPWLCSMDDSPGMDCTRRLAELFRMYVPEKRYWTLKNSSNTVFSVSMFA